MEKNKRISKTYSILFVMSKLKYGRITSIYNEFNFLSSSTSKTQDYFPTCNSQNLKTVLFSTQDDFFFPPNNRYLKLRYFFHVKAYNGKLKEASNLFI